MSEVRIPEFTGGAEGAVEEAELIEWHVEDGERVAQGQEILQLELDKVTVAVEAPAAGVLRHLCRVGSLVKPGEVVASIDEG
jgi:pyruvate/2-oxoglutarate dehydrogenase complex dihydrolipoamide acyltransferase (E2) component